MSQTVNTTVSQQTLAPLDVPPATLVALSAAANLAPETLNVCDSSGGTFAVTLPQAASCIGRSLRVFLNVAGNNLTITPFAGDDINGSSSSLTLSSAHTAYKLVAIAAGQWIALSSL